LVGSSPCRPADDATLWFDPFLRGIRVGMRLGVLDVGSNAAQLQVVDAFAGAPPLPIHAVKMPTRLSDEVGSEGAISERGVDRVVEAVERALEAARELTVDQLYPFVTAAIRDASNRGEILDRILNETGVGLRFLSGEDEARLTYLAVRSWYGWQAGRVLNIDIGGGSMELAFGRDAVPELAVSLPLGAARVSTDFLLPDPPSTAQIKALRRHVRAQVRDVANRVQWEGTPRRVVATSKTFKQLARLGGAASAREGPFVRRTVTKAQIAQSIVRLLKVAARDRGKIRGIKPARAWQILGGAVVAYETMRCLRVREAEISPWALREGIVLQHLSSLRGSGERLTLDPLVFDRSVKSATITPLVNHMPDASERR
jgi:exopolyphosphatase / guanosine-5'-triphosphate,3'-diphosphate pyrophosphatase